MVDDRYTLVHPKRTGTREPRCYVVRQLSALALAMVLVFTSGCVVTAPPPGPVAGPWPELRPPAPSRIDVPISVDLSEAFARINTEAPTHYSRWRRGNDWHWMRMPNIPFPTGDIPLRIVYWVDRGPLNFTLEGSSIIATTELRYATSADIRVVPPIPPIPIWIHAGSCGRDGNNPSPFNQRPGFRVRMSSHVDIRPEWALHSRTEFRDPAVLRRCVFSPLPGVNIDMTERIQQALASQLRHIGDSVDTSVRRFEMRPHVERAWTIIQEPVELGENLWLTLSPSRAHIAPLAGSGHKLSTAVGVTAMPQIVVGPRPVPDRRSLPVATGQAGSGFHVVLDAMIGYEEASEQLRDLLLGQRVEGSLGLLGRRWIEVTDAQLRPLGAGQVVLEVEFRGRPRGTLYLVGTPIFDEGSQSFWVPDLDFALETRHVLERSLAWVLRSQLREELVRRSRISVGQQLDDARDRLNAALNSNLSDEFKLNGAIESLEILGVQAGNDRLLVRSMFVGDVAVELP